MEFKETQAPATESGSDEGNLLSQSLRRAEVAATGALVHLGREESVGVDRVVGLENTLGVHCGRMVFSVPRKVAKGVLVGQSISNSGEMSYRPFTTLMR